MLGALCAIGVLPINRQGLETIIRDLLPLRLLEKNLKAFDKGGEVVQES